MGIMSAEYDNTTRPPDVVEPYAESAYHQQIAMSIKQQQEKSRGQSDMKNTNCNNETGTIATDPSTPTFDPFSSSCDADLEVICHIVESPYVSVDRKWLESARQGSCKINGVVEKEPYRISGTENTNQSNQTNPNLLNLPEGSDSVINPGYSSIDRYREIVASPVKDVRVEKAKDIRVERVKDIRIERVESFKDRPVRVESIKDRPIRVESFKDRPIRVESIKDRPIRVESFRDRPIRVEKAKDVKLERLPSVREKTTDIIASRAKTDVSRLRESIALPGRAIRINSTDGQSSVVSSNTSVNLMRQGSNVSNFSINTSRTRVIRKDKVKWGTLDHRKLEEVTPSKFVNGRYVNPWDTWQEATFGRLCRWFCSSEHRNIPSQKELDETLPILKPSIRLINRPPRNGIRMTWLGHSTCLVQFDGITILTDPVFSEKCGPTTWLGKKRYRKSALTVHELPKIDAVVISHSHYDHLDLPSVESLNAWFGSDLRWFVPLGLKEWFTTTGCENVIELDWWQENCIPSHSDITFAFTPSQHWGRRTLTDTNKALWGSWCIMGPNHSFFFAGDTGYCKGFKEIGKRYGPFDLAAIPIGAYEPRWFKKAMHTDPADAVQIHQDILAKKSVGIHWGTFRMGNEYYLDPPEEVKDAMRAQTLDEHDFFTMKHGEVKLVISED